MLCNKPSFCTWEFDMFLGKVLLSSSSVPRTPNSCALFSVPHAGLYLHFWPCYQLGHFHIHHWGYDDASSLLGCGLSEAKSALCLLIGYLQDSRNKSKVRGYGFWIRWLLAISAGCEHPEWQTIHRLTWLSWPSVCWLNNYLLDRPTHQLGSWCFGDWLSWTTSGLGPIFPDHT